MDNEETVIEEVKNEFASDDNLNNYLENFFINNVVGTYEILYCSDFILCSESTICQ